MLNALCIYLILFVIYVIAICVVPYELKFYLYIAFVILSILFAIAVILTTPK